MKIKVLAVNGSKIQITDGTSKRVVSREQLKTVIDTGKVELDTVKVKCIDKQRDKNNNITAYLLCDESGKQMVVTPQ